MIKRLNVAECAIVAGACTCKCYFTDGGWGNLGEYSSVSECGTDCYSTYSWRTDYSYAQCEFGPPSSAGGIVGGVVGGVAGLGAIAGAIITGVCCYRRHKAKQLSSNAV